MKELFEAIAEILPIADFLQTLGMEKDKSGALATVLNALFIWGAVSLVKSLNLRFKNSQTAKKLNSQFDYASIKKATEFYIPTQYQNASPSRQDEPLFTHKYISKSALIPFMLKTAFNQKRESERFYLILADSGMGKTTFMVNLYMKYVSFWNRHRENGVQIKLFRLGVGDTMDLVKEIKEKEAEKTILLLDALDEDPKIIPESDEVSDEECFNKRVDEIIETTRYFKEVVITCRTQYFPGQEDDPYELKIRRPDEQGYYFLNKLYISPFDDKEIKRYLNKKYPFWQIWNQKLRKRAEQIAKNSPKLVVRPMLLSYIDLLAKEQKEYKTIFEIYETLIEKWLIREALKRKSKEEQPAFIRNLRQFSQKTALTIYNKQKENRGLFLLKEQAVAIAKDFGIELDPHEVTGQSLLTSDGSGNWKFAHKSILEFFMAKEALKNRGFLNEVAKKDFVGIDMMKLFYEEVSEEVFVKGGIYKTKKVKDFFIKKTVVTQKLWEEVMGNNPSHFKGNDLPVEQFRWYDAIEFCNKKSEIEGLIPYYNIDKSMKDPNNLNKEDDKKWAVTINTSANGFRLPTELEWEYAASGGNKSKGFKYAGSNNLDEVGWYNKNSKKTTHAVKQKQPNELGLYDMSGNVWEWCWDWYGEEAFMEPEKGERRVIRGGSWNDNDYGSRVAYSYLFSPVSRLDRMGFRISRA